jgi:hypothetical protein
MPPRANAQLQTGVGHLLSLQRVDRASCEADPIAQSCIGVARRTSSLLVPYTHELKHSGWSSPSSGAASER